MKSANIPEIIRMASILSVLIPLIFYLIRMKTSSRTMHKIGGVIVLSAVSDAMGFYFFKGGESTVFLFNTYYLALFFFLAWFYSGVLTTAGGRNTVIIGVLAYVLSFILVTAFVQGYDEYQTFMWTITGMIVIIFSISYFLSVFSAQLPMENFGLLWINSGILFYFSFNLFLFVMSSYVLTKLAPELSMLIWSFHNVNNIIKNVLLALGISLFKKEEYVLHNVKAT
jgi:hypothetical protein